MKNLILLTLLTLGVTLKGQKVMEMDKTMSLGPQPSFYIEIENTPEKVVKNEWKDYLKEQFKKVKYNRKAKEYYTEDGNVSLINGSNDITIYSKLDEGKDLVTLFVWVELADGLVNSDDYSSQAKGTKQYLSDFWIIATKKGISIELEDEEDNLKDFEKDLKNLEKKNKNLHEDIEKFKEKIRQAEADIEENLKNQDDKRVEIEDQKKIIEQVKERLNNVGKN